MSNIVVGSAPLALSSSWFSPGERVTATTIAQVFNGLGTGMSFLLASQVVRPIDNLVGKHMMMASAATNSRNEFYFSEWDDIGDGSGADSV